MQDSKKRWSDITKYKNIRFASRTNETLDKVFKMLRDHDYGKEIADKKFDLFGSTITDSKIDLNDSMEDCKCPICKDDMPKDQEEQHKLDEPGWSSWNRTVRTKCGHTFGVCCLFRVRKLSLACLQ